MHRNGVKCHNVDNNFLNKVLELWLDVHFVQDSSLVKMTAKAQYGNNSLIRVEKQKQFTKTWVKTKKRDSNTFKTSKDNSLIKII